MRQTIFGRKIFDARADFACLYYGWTGAFEIAIMLAARAASLPGEAEDDPRRSPIHAEPAGTRQM
jgi:hypothetical protein